MTTPAELSQTPDNLEAMSAFGAEEVSFAAPATDETIAYIEIAERRARLENADILRRARAL